MLRHFLTGTELDKQEVLALCERALELRQDRLASAALSGASVALIFEKPSTRTRVSFEVGIYELGANPLVLRGDETQLSRGESLRDTAAVLSRYVQAVLIRTGPHAVLSEFASYSSVCVINMLTDTHHPCQVLADLLTLRQRFGSLEGLKLCYVGDGSNVANSLLLLGAKAGVHVVVASPPELAPSPEIVSLANSSGVTGSASVVDDPYLASRQAHALYTDVWLSMGTEADAKDRRRLLEPYRLSDELLAHARADAIALHCLPAHPGDEISESVLYGERSAVWDQAENRLHAQKALLELLVSNRPTPGGELA
jgi:ornithine carbamoyltransferase